MDYSELWNKYTTISSKYAHELLQKCTYRLKNEVSDSLPKKCNVFWMCTKVYFRIWIFFLILQGWLFITKGVKRNHLIYLEVILCSLSNIMRKITYVAQSFIRDLFFKPYNKKLYLKLFKPSKVSPYSIIVLGNTINLYFWHYKSHNYSKL